MEFGPSAINALADLVAPKVDSDSEEDMPSNYYAKLTPGNIGPAKVTEESTQKATKLAERQSDSKEIWDADEVNDGSQYDDVYDTRQRPDYDIIYKQAVSSEDMYLGMGNKTPATASCEDMVINVKLPGTEFKSMNVDLTDKHLSIRSPKYRLGLHLPHPCDSKLGKAQWLSETHILKITVKLKREYDMFNF
ncbi:dynein axonemal assembly factor 6-like [Watersipora subatra]|uniref:dynein axonemal assembly factor 6-like n=1 Tax=Watersipora subatra TaxID=2589382 RepID=UPI00355B4800